MMTRKTIVTWSVIILALVVIVATALLHQRDTTKDTLRLASLLPLDGQVAAYGEMMRNGQTMAAEDINATPNISPKVQVVFFNTSHQKDVALDRLKEATNSGIRFVAEIFGSDQLAHCFEYSLAHNLFVVSGVDTRPDLVSKGRGVFFPLMPNDAAAASFLLQWANELGLKRLGIVYANDVWGEGLRDAAVSEAQRLKIEIVDSRDISRHQTSFAAAVSQLNSFTPDGVLLFVYPDDGGNLLKEARRQQLNSKFFATENFAGTDMVSTAKSAAQGVMMVSPAAPEGGTLADFKKRYQSKFGTEPTIFALKGYDSIRFVYDVAVKSGLDPMAARQKAKSYRGSWLTGPIAFNQSGDFIPGRYERLRFMPKADSFEAVPVEK